MVRHRTTGVVTEKFKMRGKEFHIFDVGGQRSERRKWIHCFEDVTAIIYVASLSSYNEVMFEDEEVNTMHDCLELFAKTTNLRWFDETPVILFLNKQDLFALKIQSTPITVCWPEYRGEHDYESSLEFIQNQFKERAPEGQDLYVHATVATDALNVERVFQSVTKIVLRDNLHGGMYVCAYVHMCICVQVYVLCDCVTA